VESSKEKNLIDRALQYPYIAPTQSYLFSQGQTFTADQWPKKFGINTWGQLLQYIQHQYSTILTPVIAYGSNRSPTQLLRKYGTSNTVPILSVQTRIKNYDVVRSAHFTSYGTLAATIVRSTGTSVEVFIQFFPPDALQRLHKSEALGRNYQFTSFPQNCHTLDNAKIQQPMMYQGLHGHVKLHGSPIAFTELPAKNRVFPESNQTDTLKQIHTSLKIDLPFTQWIQQIIRNKEYRKTMTQQVKHL
jgi:hypothetical protein